MNSLNDRYPLPRPTPKERSMKLWLRFAIPTGLAVVIAILAVTSMNTIFAHGASTNQMSAFTPAQLQTIQQNLAKQHQADLKEYKGIQPLSQKNSLATNPNLSGPPPTYNNIAISNDTNTTNANFDGTGNSYSYTALAQGGLFLPDITSARPYIYDGITFSWFHMLGGYADNYQANGQVLAVTPVNNATTVGLIGASSKGNASGTATITYTDGTTQDFQLGMSDWTLSGNTAQPAFGNGIVAIQDYRNTSIGQQKLKTYLFYASVTLQAGKTIQTVTLPTTTAPGQLHIFDIGTRSGYTSLYTNTGTSYNANPAAGNFDGGGNSYSYEDFFHYTPFGYNSMQLGDGITRTPAMDFTGPLGWFDELGGVPDDITARGQTLAITPVAGAGYLGLIGSATNGPSYGTASITYTDRSTQNFQLGMSDWTLNGNKAIPSFGNRLYALYPHRNAHTGQQNVYTYLFYVQIKLQAGKTVQGLTLPSSANQGQIHLFGISTGTTEYANNTGAAHDGELTAFTNFDGSNNAYSIEALRQSAKDRFLNEIVMGLDGITPDNYIAAGQNIAISTSNTGGANHIVFLGSATGGTSSGIVTLTYSDGSTQTGRLAFSDWCAPQTLASTGDQIAEAMPYRDTLAGKQYTKNYLYYAEAPINTQKTLVSATLPNPALGQGKMHIFYMGLDGRNNNNVGISDDTIPFAANFDGVGNSYSEQALVKAGVTSNASGYYIYNGIYFDWSIDPQNVLDNLTVQHQTVVPFPPAGIYSGTTTLAFLGSATNGNSSGIATIHYTDGSTQTFTLGMTDWTLNGNKTQPAFGNKIVVTMPYRNIKTGQQYIKNYMFFAQVSLQKGKILNSVTLPATAGGTMHIFSIALQ